MREDIQRESSGSRQTQSGGESSGGSGGVGSPGETDWRQGQIQIQSEVDQDSQILERQKFIKYGIIGVVLYMVCC